MTRGRLKTAFGPLNVSRETEDDLDQYAQILKKWNGRINLISRSTLPKLWERHILDSAQLWHVSKQTGHWVDLGSGGGFPGLVVAILAKRSTELTVTLVESDQRKAAFLRTVVRELRLAATIISTRIEALDGLEADILSARALAPLNVLLGFTSKHRRKNGEALFPKGASVDTEIKQALEHWQFDCEKLPSVVDPESTILRIGDVTRA